ncbi:MAG: ABC transporter substrate-binding protein [Eubacteriales bacterium]|nr:ABC transporter substrate-binding protein [Clostridiales bacterium]MDD6932551.1 ABC transporter substrate-binding protein [Eubacteriales bacterium]MDO4388655.1 ABC transporter substrate-binding protein [Eubacteriales bacterium]MDY2600927.1 ABC transporter substrate-binding protein [Eubacteriales bacterium]
MKKVLSMVLVLMLTCVLCASAEQTLVIGGTGPLTGDYATYGTSVRNGATLAAEEINEAGGVNGILFDVKMEDDQADPEKAINGYSILVDEGMQVSLGAVTSGACLSLIEEAQVDGMLVITPSASQKECVQYDNCFRVCFTDPMQGVYAADFISDNAIATKVAIIYDKSNDYSVGIHDNFVSRAGEVGIDVVTDQAFTSQSNIDFSVQLQAVKDSGAELVFLPIYAQEAAYILTQAKSAGIEATFFGCDGLDGILTKIGEGNTDACEGVMLLTPFAADAQDEKTVNFTTKYKEQFGETPDQFAADAYDAVYAIKAAMEQAGITDLDDPDLNEKLISAMTEITVEGVTGTMTWDAEGEPSKSATAVVIKDGAYVAYSAQ